MMSQEKEMGTIDSLVLGEYILKYGGDMSHLKLQKILYYIQAYHLAYFGLPIFEDDFEAWAHGPVSRKVFSELREISLLYNEIRYVYTPGETPPEEILSRQLTDEQVELVNDVIKEYGTLTGLQLENLTHSESPWLDSRKGYGPGDKCSVVIPKETIQEYFRSQIYG